MFQIIKNAFKFNNIIRDQNLTRFLEEIDLNVGNAWQKAKIGRRVAMAFLIVIICINFIVVFIAGKLLNWVMGLKN